MKRKNFKKMLALLLASTMCVSVCACGSKVSEEGSAAEAVVATESEETGAAESKEAGAEQEESKKYWEMLDEVQDTSELPDWEGEILEVNSWAAFGTGATIGEISESNVTFKELERVTGVRFNADESFSNNGDNIDAVVPKLVATDNFPTFAQMLESQTVAQDLFDNGFTVDLAPYIEKGYLDQVFKWIPEEHFAGVWEKVTNEDGSVYAIPFPLDLANYYEGAGYDVEGLFDAEYYNTHNKIPENYSGVFSHFCIWVRDDVLQALYPDALTMDEIKQIYIENGKFTEEQILDVPLNSAEDFINFLYDVQELLNDGEFKSLNGQQMEVTYGPNTETDAWQLMDSGPKLINGWGNSTNYFAWLDRNAVDESSVLQRAIDRDEYKEWFKTLNTLVNDDVMSKNSFVDNSATFNEKINNGYYAVTYGGGLPGYPFQIDGSEGGWSYRPIWVNYEAPDKDMFCTTGSTTVDYCLLFKKDYTEEQVEQLVHCLNYLHSPIGINNFNIGPLTAGLFTMDENGMRTLTEEGLAAISDNSKLVDYGLWNYVSGERKTFTTFPTFNGGEEIMRNATYTNGYVSDGRNEEDAFMYFNPGLLEGRSKAANSDVLATDYNVQGLGQNLESMKNFWSARSGYEAQIIKTVAASPEKFEQEYNNLLQYADDNFFTQEAMQEFSKYFVEANRKELNAAGILD